MRCSIVYAVFVGLTALPLALSDPVNSVPSSDHLVQSLASYFESLRRIQFTALTEDQCRSDLGAGPLTRIESEVSRDNDSWRVFEESTEHRQGKDGRLETSTHLSESFWLPSTGFRRFIYTDKNSISSIMAFSEKRDFITHAGMHLYMPLITGHVLGTSQTLVQLLGQAPPRVRQVRENEHEFYVVENETTWGITAVWLDPRQNGLPLRIRHAKGLNHLIGLMGKPLKDMPKDPEGAAIQSYESLVNVVETVAIGNRRLPRRVEVLTRSFFDDPKKFSECRGVVHYRNYHFDFTFDEKPRATVPDGTVVYMQDELHIDYEWRRGKIVKRIPEGTVQALVGHWFQAGGLIGTTTLILLLLTLAGLAIYLWYRRKVAVK